MERIASIEVYKLPYTPVSEDAFITLLKSRGYEVGEKMPMSDERGGIIMGPDGFAMYTREIFHNNKACGSILKPTWRSGDLHVNVAKKDGSGEELEAIARGFVVEDATLVKER